jgi:DNA helicase II / ATP-dependent DNA helicase PcrA
MRFHADLHIHSKYSRATSRDLDLEHLAYWAGLKGIGVVGTGDFTHPAWAAELKQKLVPAEPGLFRLAPEIEKAVAEKLPPACRAPIRFMLEVEISTIYKKGDKTRKIHHLIYAPDFATVDRISARLARIGNIASDGRPILGLDSRDLLEITLESSPDAYLVPAHIWTPWFAALGSQSGFDSITECYGDLAGHIFAVETGLSSDPPMNWRLSMLDRYRLTSNSDAHSPGKLGREATTFDCDVDYFAIRRALEIGDGFVGTVEFFPEEGKYHLDGHRKCGVRLTPTETRAGGGRCPVCGLPVTVGVEHRVEALADRSEPVAPPSAGDVSNLVALPEILSEIVASGPASKAVEQSYHKLISSLGPELPILQNVPLEDIGRASSLFGEAIARLRSGHVIREAGYDGEYGVIRLFEEGELGRLTAGGLLFDAPVVKRKKAGAPNPTSQSPRDEAPPAPPSPGRGGWTAAASEAQPRRAGWGDPTLLLHPTPALRADPPLPGEGGSSVTAANILAALDDDQRAAASIVEGPLLIVAGPGSGKTRTLTHRIAHLIAERGVAPDNCLAITFTRRAAAEMRERLAQLVPEHASKIAIHTFHSLGLMILREHPGAAGLERGFRIADEAERVVALAETINVSDVRAQRLLRAISVAQRTRAPPSGELAEAMTAYRHALSGRNWIDFDDLIRLSVQTLAADATLAALYRERYRFVSVDEFQDVDEQQYRLLNLIAPPNANICAIGDRNQAIYGFRGANSACFTRFEQGYAPAVVTLNRNYRSSGTIVSAAAQVIAADDHGLGAIVRGMHERITIHASATERAEAEFVVATIERAIGGHSFFSIDSGRGGGARTDVSFADIAVLYRTEAQSAALVEAFARSGIPFKTASHVPLGEDPAVRALLDAVDNESAQRIDAQLRAAAQQLQGRQDEFDEVAIAAAQQRLSALAEACGHDRMRFRDAVALAGEADFFEPRADRVSLLTLHAAKGLEFAVVFIAGMEDGLLPLYWGEPDEATLAEERRLFYVGMTRAKDRLFLSRALKRQRAGRVREQAPSRFLADIENELVQHQRTQAVRKPEDRQLRLF